eukprot:6868146-Pyramimonas_sp.AAC.1
MQEYQKIFEQYRKEGPMREGYGAEFDINAQKYTHFILGQEYMEQRTKCRQHRAEVEYDRMRGLR